MNWVVMVFSFCFFGFRCEGLSDAGPKGACLVNGKEQRNGGYDYDRDSGSWRALTSCVCFV